MISVKVLPDLRLGGGLGHAALEEGPDLWVSGTMEEAFFTPAEPTPAPEQGRPTTKVHGPTPAIPIRHKMQGSLLLPECRAVPCLEGNMLCLAPFWIIF